MVRIVLRYFLMVTPPLLGILGLLRIGQNLAPPVASTLLRTPASTVSYGGTFSITTLLIQLGLVLSVARAVGWIFRKLHQPQVVGEMAAGIMLGPSLLGWLAPGVSAALFPLASLGVLDALSQIGLVVFMFLVGLELDPHLVRERAHIAVVTSHVSILAPFFLGTTLALFLFPRLGEPGVPFSHFALFLGVSMSITAFPVLARILSEHQMLRTQVGAVGIACAAVDDVSAWCLLAGVVILVRADAAAIPFWATLLGMAAFVALMLLGVRGWLPRLEVAYRARGEITQDLLGLIVLLLLASALVTERLGIHALFGAFLLGAVMPKDGEFVMALRAKLEPLTVVLLLPLFFAFTGLHMSIGLLNGPEMWIYLILILIVAIAGKLGGAMISSRLSGFTWREAGAIGVLMNTRGLIELVALNIGLEIGVLSSTLFTMLVVMALLTTIMTSPLLEWIYPERLREVGIRLPAVKAFPVRPPN